MTRLKAILLLLPIFIFWFPLLSNNEKIDLSSMSVEAIDSLTFIGESVDAYSDYLDTAILGMIDTAENMSFKGEILLAVLANNLSEEIEEQRVDPSDPAVRVLLSRLSERNYHIYQPKISNIVKVIHYTCQGRYHYMFDRFSHSKLFYPLIIVIIGFLLFLGMQFRGIVSIVNNTSLFIGLVVVFLLTVFLFASFKITCDENINESTVYGINF